MVIDKRMDPLRVVLYSHDTQGLGHIRRNLAIATALRQTDTPPAILLISGTQLGTAFSPPPGIDFLGLPSVSKDGRGRYSPRSLPMSLQQLINLRMHVIRDALQDFMPDVLIVDKVPNGLLGELLPALEMLRQQGRTRCVLGLRDVLDDPETTQREWESTDSTTVVNTYYNAVWIYGDPRVYDSVQEYGLAAALAGKVHYTGYLDRSCLAAASSKPGKHPSAPPGRERLALCMVGGGEDGGDLAYAFACAKLPSDMRSILVMGPYMPAAMQRKIQRALARCPRLQVFDFVRDPLVLLRQADKVVSMGGYNSVCEILAQNKRALVVPRVRPRLEQWIRAQRLAALGLVDVLHPDELTPQHLACWLEQTEPHVSAPRQPVDLNGFTRLPYLLHQLVQLQPA